MDVLAAMRVFVGVVDAGSFARAAEHLALSRPMVTTRLAQLERHLGTRLLARTTRRLSLTDEGRSFYARAQRILADLAEAEEAVGSRRATARGKLRVAMPGAFAHLVLIPALPRLLDAHPGLSLEAVIDDRPLDLVATGLDCAVRVAPVSEGDLVARRLGTARLVTCAAPAYLAEHASPSEPADLHAHACIGWIGANAHGPAPWAFDLGGDTVEVAPPMRIAFGTMEAAVHAAIEGLGIVQAYSSVAHRAILDGKLVPLLVEWTAPGPPVSIVYPGNRYLSAKVRTFADFAAEIFPTESWWRDILAVARNRRP